MLKQAQKVKRQKLQFKLISPKARKTMLEINLIKQVKLIGKS